MDAIFRLGFLPALTGHFGQIYFFKSAVSIYNIGMDKMSRYIRFIMLVIFTLITSGHRESVYYGYPKETPHWRKPPLYYSPPEHLEPRRNIPLNLNRIIVSGVTSAFVISITPSSTFTATAP